MRIPPLSQAPSVSIPAPQRLATRDRQQLGLASPTTVVEPADRPSSIDLSSLRPPVFRSDLRQNVKIPSAMALSQCTPSKSMHEKGSRSPCKHSPRYLVQKMLSDSPLPRKAPFIGSTSFPFVTPPLMGIHQLPFSPEPSPGLQSASSIIPPLASTPANKGENRGYFPSVMPLAPERRPRGLRCHSRPKTRCVVPVLRLQDRQLSLVGTHSVPPEAVSPTPPVPPTLRNSPYLRGSLLPSPNTLDYFPNNSSPNSTPVIPIVSPVNLTAPALNYVR